MNSSTFIEKKFYCEPPNLLDGASDGEIKSAWDDWANRDSQARAVHKQMYTKSQQHSDLPDVSCGGLMIKYNGVWTQRAGMTAFIGSAVAETLETIVYQSATQDKHFQARGVSGKNRNTKRRGTRKREMKRQRILNNIL